MKVINHNFMKKFLFRATLFLLASINLTKLSAQDTDEELNKSFEQELEQTKQLIVMLRVELDGSKALGTGIIVGREKNELLIVTAYHLLHRGTVQAKNIQVKFRAKPGKLVEATILKHGNEEEMDWALLSVKDLSGAGMDPCSIKFDRKGETSTLKRGDDVFPMGNPNGIEWAIPVAPDKVSEVTGNDIVFQSAFISNGHSGGALLDSSAKIVGMIIEDQPPFGKAIHIDSLLKTVSIYCQLYYDDYEWANYSLLHLAANDGDLEWIRYLLTDHCYNINVRDAAGRTPLHYTAGATSDALISSAKFSLEAMKLLVSAGADVNALDDYGSSPLGYAAGEGKIEQVKFLVKSGAQINNDSEKFSPLIIAIVNKKPETTAFLINSGARIDKPDKEGYTPLFHAIENWDIEIVQKLLKSGANVNAKLPSGETPLHLAAKLSTKEAIKILLKGGANVNSKDNEGVTPLHDAVLNTYHYEDDYFERLVLLLDAGANINITDANGKTPLDYANDVPAAYSKHKDIEDLFKKYTHK